VTKSIGREQQEETTEESWAHQRKDTEAALVSCRLLAILAEPAFAPFSTSFLYNSTGRHSRIDANIANGTALTTTTSHRGSTIPVLSRKRRRMEKRGSPGVPLHS